MCGRSRARGAGGSHETLWPSQAVLCCIWWGLLLCCWGCGEPASPFSCRAGLPLGGDTDSCVLLPALRVSSPELTRLKLSPGDCSHAEPVRILSSGAAAMTLLSGREVSSEWLIAASSSVAAAEPDAACS